MQENSNDKAPTIADRIDKLVMNSIVVLNEEITTWKRANFLYKECFDDIDNPANLYNPMLMLDILDRVIDDLALAQYIITIPNSDIDHRQMVRDAISYVEDGSGLTSAVKESDKGAWSWAYYGNMILWWGKSDKEAMKAGIPIKFQNIRLTHAFFSSGCTQLRDNNGFPICKEALLIQELPIEDVREEFKNSKNIDQVKVGNITKAVTTEIETKRWATKMMDNICQVGYYYDPIDKVYVIVAGADGTVLEEYYDDAYPHNLDGVSYIPATLLRCFSRYDRLYGKGVYHKYAKLALNDRRRRALAHRAAEDNVSPDKFIEIDDENFATFHNQIETAREIKRQGGDAYVQIKPGDKVQTGDLRTMPLSQEFERMKQDDYEQVSMSGVAIGDMSIPATQAATNTVVIERNKTRMVNRIIKTNASEAVFLRRIIADYISRYLKNSTALLPTTSKITIEADNKLHQFVPQGITLGDVAQYISKKSVFIRSNFSAFDDVGFKLGRINDAKQFAAGTPYDTALNQEALESLGYDVKTQDLGMPGAPSNQSNSSNNAPQTVQNLLAANAPVPTSPR